MSNTPAPAAPERWVAVSTDGALTIAKVTRDHVEVVATDAAVGRFGWLDEHTLLVVQDHALRDDQGTTTRHEIAVARYVDGRLLDESKISDTDWPDQVFVEAAITRGGEAWISKCVLDGHECTGQHRVYRRLFPTRSPDQDRAPTAIEAGRLDDHDETPWPLPRTAPTPAGIALAAGKVDVVVTDPYSPDRPSQHAQENGAICDAHGKHLTYPESEWDGGFGPDQTPRTVRWVSSDPPVFEMAEDWVNPAGFHFMMYTYARACEPAFDGYAWLGGDLWASFALASHDPPNGFGPGEPPRVDGDWTFHAGDKVIGTIHGIAYLRANLIAP
jgi:hypothetical protein